MKRKNTTRNALLTSIISMLLCVSMLVGTTFAWFTDKAESGLNQIIAGNLDVELLYKDGNAYKNAADVELFDDIELWEPGVVAYETVKIANVGNLALKYALSINTGNENTLNGHGLSEVLRFAVIQGEVTGKTRAEVLALAEASKNKGMLTAYTFGSFNELLANTESDPMTLVVYWPATTNEFDNLFNVNNGQKTSDGAPLHIDLGLKVLASQETVEEDSFDKYYDDTASYPTNKWLGDVAEKLLVDEATKTITISSGAELAKLAADVNSGTTYAGYTVKLTDSIDLNNIAWTPIGTEDKALKAEVDGQGHTIYNLNVTGTTCVGLFGHTYTDGNNGTSITNVHVVNATVTGNHWVGAVVGKLDYGNLTNCSVKNAKIIAVPNGTEGNYDNGDKVGGITGFMTEGNWIISGNKAENVYLKAYRDVGGITGIAHERNTVENNTVNNITIVVDQLTNYYGNKDFNVGAIYGRKYDSTVVGTNSESKVTIDCPDMIIPNTSITLYKAEKKDDGGVLYLNSAEDFKKLNTLVSEWKTLTGGQDHYYYQMAWKVVLNCDVDLANEPWIPVVISEFSGFDGQGYTISNLNVTGTSHVGLFANTLNNDSGKCPISNLVIDGATVTGNEVVGVVVGYGANPITNVTVKNATVNGAKYVGGIVGKTSSNIENCSVINSSVIAETKEVGGIAGFLAVETQSESKTAVITNCTVKNTTVTGADEVGGILGRAYAMYNNKIELNDNTFDGIMNATTETAWVGDILGRDYDGSGVSIDGVVLVGDAEALQTAITNGVAAIKLSDDLELTGENMITIPEGSETSVDLNGYDITADFAAKTDGASAIFTIGKNASLTINGKGDVHATAAPTLSYVSSVFTNLGSLEINGGNYSMTYGSYADGYLIPTIIDTNSNIGKATTTINGGTFFHNRNMFRNFAQPQRGENNATLIINGGTFVGEADDYATIWNQKTSGNGVEGDGIVTVNGGNFNYVEVDNEFATGVTIAAGVNLRIAE